MFEFYDNANLRRFSGFDSLELVNGGFSFYGHLRLTTMPSFPKLRCVRYNFNAAGSDTSSSAHRNGGLWDADRDFPELVCIGGFNGDTSPRLRTQLEARRIR